MIKFILATKFGSKIIDCSNMSVKQIDKTYRVYNNSKYFEIERIEA